MIRTNESYYAIYEDDLLKEEIFDDKSYRYQYNNSGQKTGKHVYYGSNTAPAFKFTYRHDENFVEEISSYMADNKPLARQSFHYEGNRLLKQRVIYKNMSDTIAWRYEYEYDKNNNLIRIVSWHQYAEYEIPISFETLVPVCIVERK